MANDLTTSPPGGFRRHGTSRGTFLTYKAVEGWADRDGNRPPSEMAAVELSWFLGRWTKDVEGRNVLERQPSDNSGTADVDALNAEIPQDQWPPGPDGKPRGPWAKFVAIKFIAPNGSGFTYEHSTWGARKAGQELEEAVLNAQFLHGESCVPIVKLGEKVRKLPPPVNQLKCPYFEVKDFRTLGERGPMIDATPNAPQISGAARARCGAAGRARCGSHHDRAAAEAQGRVRCVRRHGPAEATDDRRDNRRRAALLIPGS